jgi:hydrocephalus-inducing protein
MGKLIFEVRGEGTLPTLQVDKPTEQDADGTPILRFRKTRIGKDCILPIVLKNEGQVPATVRFDALTNDAFTFEGNMSHTITQKSYHGFDVRYCPKAAQADKFLLTFSTMNNTYE